MTIRISLVCPCGEKFDADDAGIDALVKHMSAHGLELERVDLGRRLDEPDREATA